MQRILNYGSSLQAYSLRCLIEGVGGTNTVRFIDYEPGTPLLDSGASHQGRISRTLDKVGEYASGKGSVPDKLRFLNHKRTYAKRYFPLVGIPSSRDHETDLDVQVIGSDEVFNCVQSNTLVGYSRDLFGHNSRARRLVSYGASFGNTTLEAINEMEIREDLREDLSTFDVLSVRDENSQKIVEALIGTTPAIHVDPVLAYDLMACENRIPRKRLHAEPYMIVYAYPGRLDRTENLALRALADSRGWRILTFGGFQECGDRFIDCNPFELLAYFRDAEAVVTDTFHGTIFSLINEQPFLTLVRSSHGVSYGNEEKLGFLLDSFGVGGRRVHDVTRLGEEMAVPIDWSEVASRLRTERQRSADYLQAAIGSRSVGGRK